MKILLLIAVCISFSGCALVEKGLVNLIAPNPEVVKQKTDKEKLESTQEKIIQADTEKKVDALKETYLTSSKEAHPSFFSAVVSGLHTEEGRRLGGIAVVTLSAIGVAIWKGVVAYTKGQTVLGLGRFIEKDVKPTMGKDIVRSGVGRELGLLDFKFRKTLKKKGIS